MWEFIAKYWLEALFTLILGGLTFVVKHYLKLIKESQKQHEQELINNVNQKFDERFVERDEQIKSELKDFDDRLDNQKIEMQQQMASCYANLLSVVNQRDDNLLDADKGIHEDIKNLANEFMSVKEGMLAVQGRAFKEECHRLLDPTHEITLIEYENILKDHETYHNLGGNHEGDALFSMVESKYKHSLVAYESHQFGTIK